MGEGGGEVEVEGDGLQDESFDVDEDRSMCFLGLANHRCELVS